MTRSFSDDPLSEDTIAGLLDVARRVPSAGSSRGFDFLVLAGREETTRYWDTTLPEPKRSAFRWQGLLRAPLLVLIYADAQRYVDRYRELDKRSTGLGDGPEAWTTPYWLVDASFAAMALQLAAVDRGLGVLFFGVFEHADAVAAEFGVPPDHQVIGVVAVGHPDGNDEPGLSASRDSRSAEEMIHRGRW